MAYETGIPTSAADLLDKLRLFCIAQGWTVNRWTTSTGVRELCIQKGDMYFNMKSVDNATLLVNGSNTSSKYGIAINGSDGYAGGSQWDQQPGYPVRTASATNPQWVALLPFVTSVGPFVAYHFFAIGDNIHVEVEVTTGCFHRMGFGKLSTFGTVTGNGRFFYATVGSHETGSVSGSSWLGDHIDGSYSHDEGPFRRPGSNASARKASAVRCNVDGIDGWASTGQQLTYSPTAMAATAVTYEDPVWHLKASPLNGLSPMVPIVVSIMRSDLYMSPLGVVPGIRYLDMGDLLAGEEFSLGMDTWKVFPLYQKGGRSYTKAIAILKE